MVTKAKPRKKNERNDGPYKKLRADLKAGTAGGVYIFHGEETYLRQDSVAKLRALLVPEGCEEFNYHPLEGKGLQVQALVEMAEAMPMMAENTLITVTDCDIFKLPADQRDRLTEFLNDVPPYCCLVFIYDTIPYKPVCGSGGISGLRGRPPAELDTAAFSGYGEGYPPFRSPVSDLHLWASDGRTASGDREDRGLCQRGFYHPGGH